ncbi:DUF2339 domain-containing protein [Pseudoalteromonas pernae]|uniref:DUF2339 domain-containing protein n=1 Tax=Pseudoalteromonas pernae TaxID=3118054 RepID=UPI003241C207
MEALFVLLMLLLLVVAIGGICGIVAMMQISKLNDQVSKLQAQLQGLQSAFKKALESSSAVQQGGDESSQAPVHSQRQSRELAKPDTHSSATSAPLSDEAVTNNIATATPYSAPSTPAPVATPPTQTSAMSKAQPAAEITAPPTPQACDDETQGLWSRISAQFKEHWMVWIGALALAFGGIFFVSYSLEAGLLSVTARLALGGAFGVSLLVGAEYAHRKFYQSSERQHAMIAYVPAALAAGGYISLFALTALAFVSYQLISPMMAFVMLAFVSVATSWNALRYGPLLAVIGMLGAYSVPMWVSTGSSNYLALVTYLSVLTLNLTYVVRKVRRMWLWYSIWALHLCWLLLISVNIPPSQAMAMITFVPVSVMLLIMIPRLGFSFSQVEHRVWSFKNLVLQKPDHILLGVIFIAVLLFSSQQGADILGIQFWLLSAVFALATLLNSRWQLWPALSVVLLGLLLDQPYPVNADLNHDGLLMFYGSLGQAQIAMVAFLVFGTVFANRSAQHIGFSLITGSAVLLPLVLSYLVLPDAWLGDVKWFWVLELLLGAAFLVFLAKRTGNTLQQAIYWCAINAHLAFSATLVLGTHALTLALAIQVVLMCYLSNRFAQAIPSWLLKALVTLVVARLTLLWIEPPFEGLDLDAIGEPQLWLYPLVAGLFVLAYRLFANASLKPWLLGAVLHVLALWVSVLTSYLIVSHTIELHNLSLLEKLVLSLNWGLLGCVYVYRAKAAKSMEQFYTVAGGILLAIAAIFQAELLTEYNPWLNRIAIGDSLITSYAWLYYCGPVAVLSWLAYQLRPQRADLSRVLFASAGAYAFIFINSLLRQYWQGQYIVLAQGVEDAELYSYSVVWLLIGAALVSLGLTKAKLLIQRVGVALLALVIAKVFLVDMANLTGLLRALSFIGLGLALVALGALFKWLQNQHPRAC